MLQPRMSIRFSWNVVLRRARTPSTTRYTCLCAEETEEKRWSLFLHRKRGRLKQQSTESGLIRGARSQHLVARFLSIAEGVLRKRDYRYIRTRRRLSSLSRPTCSVKSARVIRGIDGRQNVGITGFYENVLEVKADVATIRLNFALGPDCSHPTSEAAPKLKLIGDAQGGPEPSCGASRCF